MGRRFDALHPLIVDASRGHLPDWAVISPQRFDHSERVARLMRSWAKTRGLRKSDLARWSAAGYLHDALKGVSPTKLRKRYDFDEGLPDPLLHGPACAQRLEREGVEDDALIRAVAHHTTGHPGLDLLGASLYMADYLDPGRRSGRSRRKALRARLPGEHGAVLAIVAAAKIGTLLERRLHIQRSTLEFWNEVVAAG
ncbi:MAG: HD domain-containing protein [Gemmatimonadota bacterium]|nr:HD domain-containing protein [Gemmatimonadota bacterium]